MVSTEMIEFPFGLPGRIFRSPMPFATFDIRDDLFRQYIEKNISVVVMLAEEEESIHATGINLKKFYKQKGMKVIHLPIPDFGIPDPKSLSQAVREVISAAEQGKNIVIHCYAGLGRTGMFAACIARQLQGVDGGEAVQWVRQHVRGSVETPEQMQMIYQYQPFPNQPGFERDHAV